MANWANAPPDIKMIYCVTGKPGKGKSYWFVRRIERWLNKKIDVYSIIDIDETKLKLKKEHGTLYTFSGLRDFRYIQNGIVVLDEAGAFFEAREWAKFSPDDRVKFQQHRKMELDIYLGVQAFSRLDTSIRQLVTEIIECDSFPGSSRENKRTPWFFWTRNFDPETVELKKRKSSGFEFYLFDKRIASAYDTKQFVNLHNQTAKPFLTMREKILKLRKGVI